MKAMVSQKQERTLSVHKEHELLLKLEIAGLNDELTQRVIDSKGNDLATKIIRLIQNGGFEPTTSQKRAREIMGKNFFGVEEAIKHLGISPSQEQAALLSEIPFSEAVLQETKDSHILVAVFPPSIKEIRSRVERKLFCSHEDAWYNSQEFAQKTGKTQWMLIQKTPVPNSTSKTWQEQQALLGKKEEIPTAQAMVYTIIGHYLNTAERLFEKIYVRTSSLASGGGHVDVGRFDSGGLYVRSDWHDDRDGDIAVSSSRKS
jgi:hypothetical protein